jgi:16S rRNA (guanine(966)-N(2))-methyltransferase RsmD
VVVAQGLVDHMRVIAGKFRSRVLRSLPGTDIRPTADRLRETLFNILTAGNPSALEGTAWIDLFAGSGAVGIEAISRGAAKVHFVESSVAAVGVIRQNLKSLGIEAGVEVLQQDVVRALPKLGELSADYVFLDPPYRLEGAYQQTLELLTQSPLLTEKTIVIAEHQKRFDPGDEAGTLKRYRTLNQGDATLSFYQSLR